MKAIFFIFLFKKFIIKKAAISTIVFNNKFATAEYGKENNIYVKKLFCRKT